MISGTKVDNLQLITLTAIMVSCHTFPIFEVQYMYLTFLNSNLSSYKSDQVGFCVFHLTQSGLECL